MEEFLKNEAKGTKIIGATSLEDMVAKLKKPRKVMLLVKGEVINLYFILLFAHSIVTRMNIFVYSTILPY